MAKYDYLIFDADHTLVAGVGHERLEHLPFVVAELARGFEPIPISIVVAVFVFVRCERDLGVFKLFDGRRRSCLLLLLTHAISLGPQLGRGGRLVTAPILRNWGQLRAPSVSVYAEIQRIQAAIQRKRGQMEPTAVPNYAETYQGA